MRNNRETERIDFSLNLYVIAEGEVVDRNARGVVDLTEAEKKEQFLDIMRMIYHIGVVSDSDYIQGWCHRFFSRIRIKPIRK